MSRILRIFLALSATVAIAGSAHAAKPAPINDVYVIHMILDGANYDNLWKVMDAGKLPTMKKLFVEGGATFTQAVSTFPSTSTSAYQSFVTGLLPGHAGIPHLQRFDRQRREIVDYLSIAGYAQINGDLINLRALQNPRATDLDTPSIIFELLHGHPTMSLYSSIRRGASIKIPEHVPIRAAWASFVTKYFHMVDVVAFDEIMRIYGGPLDQVPRYSLVGLYGVDTAGHYYGATADQLEDILVQFDLFLGEFLALLEAQGIRDKSYIIVSSDHGMHDTDHLFRFRKAAAEADIAVKPGNPRKKGYTLVSADRGVSSTHVYTRRTDGSFAPLASAEELERFPLKGGGRLDLIDFIRDLKPTELVIVRDGETATMIYDSDGNLGRIACLSLNARDWCSYAVIDGNDPLHIEGADARALMDGQPHSSQEWKFATADDRYPDAVMQLGTIFDDGRAGDLFIIPDQAWGFRKIKHATHGSLIKDDMRIAMFMAGPTVPRGTYTAMRTVDVYPLLIEWFGLDVEPANYDGVNPFEGYRREHAYWQTLATLEMLAGDEDGNRALKAASDRLTLRERDILRSLARMELRERTQRRRRLADYITALKRQQNDPEAPRIADPYYVADHLAIARRMQRLTEQRKEVMKHILKLVQ